MHDMHSGSRGYIGQHASMQTRSRLNLRPSRARPRSELMGLSTIGPRRKHANKSLYRTMTSLTGVNVIQVG